MGKYFTDEMANEAKERIAESEILIKRANELKEIYPELNSYLDNVILRLKEYVFLQKAMMSLAGY